MQFKEKMEEIHKRVEEELAAKKQALQDHHDKRMAEVMQTVSFTTIYLLGM